MKSFPVGLILPLLAAQATVSHVIDVRADKQCCFKLRSFGEVEDGVCETNVGMLRVLSNCPEAEFCLDLHDNKLTDEHGAKCSMVGASKKLQCHHDSLEPTRFTIGKDPKNTTILLLNDEPAYLACPADDDGPDAGYNIHGVGETNPECIAIHLVVDYISANCPTPDSIEVIPSTQRQLLDIKYPGVTSDASCEVTKITRDEDVPFKCKIDPNGPSLAPLSVTVSDLEGRKVDMDSKGEAFISPNHLTRFEFKMPANWVPDHTELCAIQFRFPYCNNLPKGYPCFKWTGLEHDSLAEAGMHWTFESSTVEDWTPQPWWMAFNTPFQLITSEVNKTVGVLGCRHQERWRLDSYQVGSINQFALRYIQAGPESGFEDGVGAFMVPCVVE